MIFLKKSQFIVISDEKQQLSKHHFSQRRVSRISLQTELSLFALNHMHFIFYRMFDPKVVITGVMYVIHMTFPFCFPFEYNVFHF